MARYKPSPELMQIYKDDLPDDIALVVDSVASKAGDLVDDLLDQYEEEQSKKLDEFKQNANKLVSDFSSELQLTLQQLEEQKTEITVQANALRTAARALSEKANNVGNLNIESDNLLQAANALESRIAAQRDKLTQLGSAVGNYVGSMAGLKLPF